MPVYFVQAGEAGPVKIGFAADVLRRLPELQVNSPFRLRALGQIKGDRLIERGLHIRFAGVRVSGEWFSPSPELLALIATAQPFPSRNGAVPFSRPSGRQWTVDEIIEAAGGVGKLATLIGVSHSSVCDWKRVERIPSRRAIAISKRLGIPLHEIRPDFWPEPELREPPSSEVAA